MRWHKEGKRDSEDSNTMSHPADVEAWLTLDHFDTKLARDPGVSVLVCQWMVFNLTTKIVVCIHVGHFLACLTIFRPTNI
jgi:hypothetical protein